MCCIYFSSKTIFLLYRRFGNEKKVYPLVQGSEFITYKKKEGKRENGKKAGTKKEK